MWTSLGRASIALLVGGLVGSAGARKAAADPDPLERYGMSLGVGGGVEGFTGRDMRETAGTGGLWDVRAAFGTRMPIGVEAAYLGSVQSAHATGLDRRAALIGTAVEADARVNILPKKAFEPYVFLGAAWRRYDLIRDKYNASDVKDRDNLLEVPMGAGVGYRYRGFLVDARSEFRAAANGDLVSETGEPNKHPAMHTWDVNGRLAYEF